MRNPNFLDFEKDMERFKVMDNSRRSSSSTKKSSRESANKTDSNNKFGSANGSENESKTDLRKSRMSIAKRESAIVFNNFMSRQSQIQGQG